MDINFREDLDNGCDLPKRTVPVISSDLRYSMDHKIIAGFTHIFIIHKFYLLDLALFLREKFLKYSLCSLFNSLMIKNNSFIFRGNKFCFELIKLFQVSTV